MIPILYDSTETAFDTNGLGRLRDCINCVVTEERNGIYECDFDYPVNGAHFDMIQCGRIIGVTHDETGDVQPFDIVSYSKPLNGIVTFHAVHISYRQSRLVVSGTNINSLADAFTMLATATPANPFTYQTDKTSTGYMSAADGVPKTVRQMLGGVEGSILDAYGGEYEWNRFNVKLWSARGRYRPFTIRYGVNLTEYNDDTDYQETFTSCVPYWLGSDQTVIGNKVSSGSGSFNGRDLCVPLDLTSKFETAPTAAQLEAAAASYMSLNSTNLPAQTINVSFIRLDDSPEYASFAPLLRCSLCDTVNVTFPRYGMTGSFKIVKTVWNVLKGRYDEMELGTLSVSLSDALGITQTTSDVKNDIQSIWNAIETLNQSITELSTSLVVEAASASFTQNRGTQSTYTMTKTKSGYYPIGIGGWSLSGTGVGQIVPYTCYISSASVGSVTVTYGLRNNNTSSNISGTFYGYVIWQKR